MMEALGLTNRIDVACTPAGKPRAAPLVGAESDWINAKRRIVDVREASQKARLLNEAAFWLQPAVVGRSARRPGMLCTLEHSRRAGVEYSRIMPLEYMKSTIAGVWVVAVCATGWLATVTSVSGWIVLGCLAVLPPIVMLRLWNDPPQSMSESIREARR